MRKKRERREGETAEQRERRLKCEELYALLLAGSEGAAEQLIRLNLPRVLEIVKAVLSEQPKARYLHQIEGEILSENNNSDLVSAGIEGLCETVAKLAISKPEDASGYIHRAIDNRVRVSILASFEVSPTPEYMQSLVKSGKPSGELRAVSNSVAADTLAPARRNGRPLPTWEAAQRDEVAEIDLQHDLEACCETPQERKILRLRAAGMTDAEIAKQLKCDERTVNRARQRMRSRFYCEGIELQHTLTSEDIAERCRITLEDAERMPRIINLPLYAKA